MVVKGFFFSLFSSINPSFQLRYVFPIVNREWQGRDCVLETCCIVNLLLGKSLNTRLGAQMPHCELGLELCIMNKNRCQHALVSKH